MLKDYSLNGQMFMNSEDVVHYFLFLFKIVNIILVENLVFLLLFIISLIGISENCSYINPGNSFGNTDREL